MSQRTALVIGSGIIGLCTAYALQERGFQVTLVDREGPDRNGCSFGNAGMIVPSHFVPLAAPGMVGLGLRMLPNPESPFAFRLKADPELLAWAWQFYRSANAANVQRAAPLLLALHLASRAEYERLAETLGEGFGLTKRGLLMFCKSKEALHEEAEFAARGRGMGLEAEVLSPEEAHRLDPTLRLDVAGAVYCPQDCHLDPGRFIAALTRGIAERGAEFVWGTRVNGWRQDRGQVKAAITSNGELQADEYVVAGGSWSANLAKPLGLRLPLQGGRGYSITLPQPRVLPQLCSILMEARIAVTPMHGSLRFAGTMELGVGGGEPPNPRRVRGMVRSIPQYFPDFQEADFQTQSVWSGLRPCSPDGMPYLGRVPGYGNVTLATGHAMMGVSLAPVTGRLVAGLLSGEAPSIDLHLLRPERFTRS